jgi:DNA-binding NarL/FixJ family response regulator
MIRSGIPADEVEPYLHERAWLIDAARLLNSTSEALAAELVDGMVRATDGSTPPPSTHPGLSRREQEVCLEVLAGFSTTGIPTRLFLSPHTVQDHLKAVFHKLGVRSRGEPVARLRPES